MRKLVYGVFVIALCQFGVFAQDRIPLEETEEEKEKREFREFKETQKRESERNNTENEKKFYIYFQRAKGNSETEFERGKISSPKLGFEYRPNPMFGIGFGFSHNSLNLTSTDTSSGAILAYLLLTAPMNGSVNTSDDSINYNALLFNLVTPQKYFYGYNAMHLDFNIHFNRAKFFDPYMGIGLIAGTCDVCTVVGGELKAGTQFNFETFFTYFQVQGQMIKIKDPGLSNFLVQNNIGSLGAGIRF